MSDTVTVIIDASPIEVAFYDENTLEARAKALQADEFRADAEAAKLGAELARDQAGDLVDPANIFIDVSLGTAEAAVSTGTTFKLVSSSTGLADVRKRTSGGSDLLYQETTKAALGGTGGGALIGLSSGGTVEDAVKFVTPYQFGAVGDGVADDTDAILDADATGLPVRFPKGRFKMTSALTRSGPVNWTGEGRESVILCDSFVLNITNGSGSIVDNLYMENITAPMTIVRDPEDWDATVTLTQSNDGYQPTINDAVYWATLTSEEQAELTAADVGPKIYFHGNASDIHVSRIYGRFVSILLYDTINSSVRNNDFKGGKIGILVWNVNAQIGFNNWVIGNTVRMPSFNGIGMARNTDGGMIDNFCELTGESGLKTWQDTISVGGVDVDHRCYRMQIRNNFTRYCFFDGLDLSADYAVTENKGTAVTAHTITGNRTHGNRQTGIFGDGRDNNFIDNEVWDCGKSGVQLVYYNSSISDIKARRCNLTNTVSGVHQIGIVGDGNSITKLYVRQTVSNGAAVHAPGTNFTRDFDVEGGQVFEGNAGSITSNSAGHRQPGMTRSRQTMPQGIRQIASDQRALQLYNETNDFSRVGMDIAVRTQAGLGPIAAFDAILALATPGDELGFAQLLAKLDGAMLPGLTVAGNPSLPGRMWTEIQLPGSAPDSGTTGLNANVAMWLDESGNALKFQVKYASGTVKTGSLALT